MKSTCKILVSFIFLFSFLQLPANASAVSNPPSISSAYNPLLKLANAIAKGAVDVGKAWVNRNVENAVRKKKYLDGLDHLLQFKNNPRGVVEGMETYFTSVIRAENLGKSESINNMLDSIIPKVLGKLSNIGF